MRLCSSFPQPSVFSKIESAENMTILNGLLKSLPSTLAPEDAVKLVRTAIKLKSVNDPRARGQISKAVIRLLGNSAIQHLTSLCPNDLLVLIRGVTDNQKCLDEFILFKIAREICSRSGEFGTHQLVEVARLYCARELDDEELLSIIAGRVTSDERATLTQLIALLRSLSRVGIRDDGLIERILAEVSSSRNIWEKDAISLLISFADLDVYVPEVLPILWHRFRTRKQAISFDDEYKIIFASIYFSTARSSDVRAIIKRANKQNRIKKRLQLLSDCKNYGIVEMEEPGSLPLASPPAAYPKGSGRNITGDCEGEETTGFVSSGLHLEVASVLRLMKYEVFLEIPASSFIIDTLVRPLDS
jgi:hypothetical protein